MEHMTILSFLFLKACMFMMYLYEAVPEQYFTIAGLHIETRDSEA